MEDHPLGQPQLVRRGSVAGLGVQVGHVFVCQDQVVSGSVHVPGDLPGREETLPCSSVVPGLDSAVASTYLHEEASQQSSLQVEAVGPGAEGGLGDGELDPVQSVGQLRADGFGRLQRGKRQEVILAPLFCAGGV